MLMEIDWLTNWNCIKRRTEKYKTIKQEEEKTETSSEGEVGGVGEGGELARDGRGKDAPLSVIHRFLGVTGRIPTASFTDFCLSLRGPLRTKLVSPSLRIPSGSAADRPTGWAEAGVGSSITITATATVSSSSNNRLSECNGAEPIADVASVLRIHWNGMDEGATLRIFGRIITRSQDTSQRRTDGGLPWDKRRNSPS